VPLTLTVGDYVISNSVCIERKSLQDLRGSLASGRLYQQAEQMVRTYRRPVLLIEFAEDKPFNPHYSTEHITTDIAPRALQSRLSLLTLHFPTLRILWSRSPRATAELIFALKQRDDEPDPTRALGAGVALDAPDAPFSQSQSDHAEPPSSSSSSEGGGGGAIAPSSGSSGSSGSSSSSASPARKTKKDKDRAVVWNRGAVDLLRQCPGVSAPGATALASTLYSVAECCALTEEELQRIVPPAAASQLFGFLHAHVDV
jgi:ERCC4 domain